NRAGVDRVLRFCGLVEAPRKGGRGMADGLVADDTVGNQRERLRGRFRWFPTVSSATSPSAMPLPPLRGASTSPQNRRTRSTPARFRSEERGVGKEVMIG